MAATRFNTKLPYPRVERNSQGIFWIAVSMMGLTAFAGLFVFLYSLGETPAFPYPYLFPWIAFLAAILMCVTGYLLRSGLSALVSPLMAATWTFFFPAFVVGGFCFAVGWSDPGIASLITDPTRNLPFAMLIIIVGYLGLVVGYFLPFGPSAARSILHRIDYNERPPGDLILPSVILLGIGCVASLYALDIGIVGYQRNLEPGEIDGLIYLSTLFIAEASFLLWWILFRRARIDSAAILVTLILIGTIIFRTAISGTRGFLPGSILLMIFAYVLAGKSVTYRKIALGGFVLFCFTVMGMIWGTSFRNIKGSEGKVEIGQFAGMIGDTVEDISGMNHADALELGMSQLALRLDTVSTVAVVVSRYEELEPYEKSYGLEDNIVRDATVPFIPRFLWPDRPDMSNARQFSALYLDLGENSFAITPMVDLLRNFGIGGVFVGMAILGLLLRFIYAGLIENRPISLYRSALYYALLGAASYESFYGTIFSKVLKLGIAALVGIVFVEIIAGRRRMTTATGEPNVQK